MDQFKLHHKNTGNIQVGEGGGDIFMPDFSFKLTFQFLRHVYINLNYLFVVHHEFRK